MKARSRPAYGPSETDLDEAAWWQATASREWRTAQQCFREGRLESGVRWQNSAAGCYLMARYWMGLEQ